jgi:methionyl-tRNA formyltransferase
MQRVVFMGTPEFAVASLQALHAQYEVMLVVTQPDRPAGRGRAVREAAVKVAARDMRLPVFQPDSLRSLQALAVLQEARPDVIVVAAYGEILRQNVLSLPRHGCVNVHASLLPRHRGAAPVAAAILAGDRVTGVTIMLMDAGMDTGPILAQAEEPIQRHDTTGTLTARLSHLGARLLAEALPRWLQGELDARLQDGSQATYAPLVRKEDGLIDWLQPAAFIERQVRACQPWPGAHTCWEGRRLKITRAESLASWCGPEEPGTVLEACDGVAVATGEGALLVYELQLEGKRCVDCAAFLCGQPGFVGSVLGGAAERV